MAITVDYLTSIGLDKETADKIFAERGKEIEKEKSKHSTLEAEYTALKESFGKISNEFESLKAANASAEDYKKKYDEVVAANAEREKQEKAAKAAQEKADAISARFAAVVGEKRFAHDAIKAAYEKKFSDALDDAANVGKSDADIFGALIKDDAYAFAGARSQANLPGVKPSAGNRMTREEISKIRDTATRQQAIADNIDLYITKGD